MFRDECDEIDSQMCCIISECFPSYKVEEIESWDMMKFCKVYTKAEWIMKNIRQMELNTDIVEFLKKDSDITEEQEVQQQEIQEQQQVHINSVKEDNQGVYKIGIKEVSKEEYEQYQNLMKEFPDFIK